MAFQSLVPGQSVSLPGSKARCTMHENRPKSMPMKLALAKKSGYPFSSVPKRIEPCTFGGFLASSQGDNFKLFGRDGFRCLENGELYSNENNNFSKEKLNFIRVRELLRRGIILVATLCGVLAFGWKQIVAMEGGLVTVTVMEQSKLFLRNAWPKVLPVLLIFKDHGLLLGILLALSAFFSMAETSITTLWPWKVRELAKKESENGVFKLLRRDVTRFLTTILIGTTVVNIGATALVTEAATTAFGEAGVSAATGVMTVAILLLTEITPKSIAIHNATEVARFVVKPVAWISLVLYPVGRIVTYLSMGILKLLGIKGRSEPYVTEEELKLMVRGAKLSGAIEEEKQDMLQNVLEITETKVREVMTPLVDVVAIDASASLVDFQTLWIGCPYSRVPIFEKRIDNIIGIAYAKDMLEFLQKGEPLDTTIVQELARMPVYFVPDSMSIWDLLRDFRFKKVHMAIVCNEYGGTAGIVTLKDIVEEIVGEIFDENDSKEEIQKKIGSIVMQEEGVFDVDANTSVDQLSEDLNIKMPEGHLYETVSGFVCEKFGHIPMLGECIKVNLERKNEENDASNTNHQDEKETFRLEILAGNARKVTTVRFTRINGCREMLETKEVTSKAPKLMKKKMEQ